MPHIYHGMSARNALRAWNELGGTVESRRGTGESLLRHPRLARPLLVGRSKTATRALTQALFSLQKLAQSEVTR